MVSALVRIFERQELRPSGFLENSTVSHVITVAVSRNIHNSSLNVGMGGKRSLIG